MFPRRYYPGRLFAPRYFPQSRGTTPGVTAFPVRCVVPRRGNTEVIEPRTNQARVVRVGR